jgi:hypothetical protein
MIALLAALSASAAAGMRIAIPLLLIGLLQNEKLWQSVPILSQIQPPIVIAVLTSWSLLELFASKNLLGQRILQIVQLIFSPIVGAIMGMTVAKLSAFPTPAIWIIGVVGGLLALVLQLVQLGWFYRLRGIPIWAVVLEDILCIMLVVFAFEAPQSGGLIALLLLWLAIRSSSYWYRWYKGQRKTSQRRYQEPD